MISLVPPTWRVPEPAFSGTDMCKVERKQDLATASSGTVPGQDIAYSWGYQFVCSQWQPSSSVQKKHMHHYYLLFLKCSLLAGYVFSIFDQSGCSLSSACWIYHFTHFCWWFGDKNHGRFKQLKRLSFSTPLKIFFSFIIVSKESHVMWILKGEKT